LRRLRAAHRPATAYWSLSSEAEGWWFESNRGYFSFCGRRPVAIFSSGCRQYASLQTLRVCGDIVRLVSGGVVARGFSTTG
jgi:hypothetical protein